MPFSTCSEPKLLVMFEVFIIILFFNYQLLTFPTPKSEFLSPLPDQIVGREFLRMLWLCEGHFIHAVAKLVGEDDDEVGA